MIVEKRVRRLPGFFSSPVFSLAGWCCALMAAFAAVHFYREISGQQELTYSVLPLRTIVVREDHPSDLQIFYDDNEIKTPVTGVDVVIWNSGDTIIRASDILEPVSLRTAKHASILAVQLKPSRPTTGFLAHAEKLEKGEVGITWQVCAPGDAALIRVLYSGEPGLELSIVGKIEGQGNIRRFNPPEGTIYGSDFNQNLRLLIEIYVGFVVFASLFAAIVSMYLSSLMPIWLRCLSWIGIVAFLALIAFICYGMWGTFAKPPGGFG